MCAVASALPLCLLSRPALAQETNAGAQTGIEEVIVTARKREENLQRTPIAITAFTGENLDARGIVKLNDIAQFSPNVTFDNYNSFGGANSNAIVYIRGIGQNDFVPTVEPGVGLYVDGVYLGRTVGSTLDLLDVERVEVLRGPQGTLFGRNSIGGAVSVVTKKPDKIFGTKADVTIGTDSKFNVRASVNVPFTDTLWGRFAGASMNQHGYVDQFNHDRMTGNTKTISGRGALRWMPNDAVEVNLAADYSEDNGNGPPWTATAFDYSDPNSFVMLQNLLPFLGCGATPDNPQGSTSNPQCYNSQYLFGKEGKDAGDAHFYYGYIRGASLSFDWKATDDLSFKSITAWRRLNTLFDNDDHVPMVPNLSTDLLEQEQVSQEVQLLGSAFDQKLEWIVGLYYFQEDGKNTNPVDFTPIKLISGGPFDNDSKAIFTQGTLHVTEKFDATVGVRYTKDKKTFLPDQVITDGKFTGIPVGLRVVPFEEVATKASDTTPMINLAYQWTPNVMTYATYSEGFKGGGFTQRVFPPQPFVDSFRPEFATSYELGLKSTSLDGRLRLNGAVFWTDYTDLQITVFTGIAPHLDNAGDATIKGFELEAEAVPGEGWLAQATVGYLDAGYDKVDPATGLTGNEKFERISKWTASAGLSKQIRLGAGSTLTPAVNWTYRTKFFLDSFNSTLIDQEDAVSLLNANVAWDSGSGKFGMMLGVTNLTDEDYYLGGAFQAGFGTASNIWSRGREWYLSAKFSF